MVRGETNEGDQVVPFFLGMTAEVLHSTPRLKALGSRDQVAFLTRLDLMH